jgi:UPF0755 protein
LRAGIFANCASHLTAIPIFSISPQRFPDGEILRAIGAPQAFAEGWFAPDYYLFYSGASDIDLLRRAYQRQSSLLKSAWERRSDAPSSGVAN